MVSQENIYDKIQELFDSFDGNLKVLEEQIDVDVQTEYFEYTQNFDQEFDPDDVIRNKEDIFEQDTPDENKKCMLVQLASIDDIEAFKTIERFASDPDQNLQDWAKLALQESKMLLESKILDENMVLISTGLGGKGIKLRYFVVFIARNNQTLTDWHKKTINNELDFAAKRCSGEIEEIRFYRNITTIVTLIPINVSIRKIFESIIRECNQFGNFLYKNYLVTNLKKLTLDEIREFISVHHNQLK